VNVFDHVRSSLRSLRRARLRSALSAVGVMFGVGALVSTLAVGEGARAEILAQVARLGTHTVLLQARTEGTGGPSGMGSRSSLTALDVEVLQEQLPGVRHVAPLIELDEITVDTPLARPPRLIAVTWRYFRVKDLELASGRPLAQADEARRALVCVLGAEVARDLGPRGRVGAQLVCGRTSLEVIGVLAARAAPSERQRVVTARDLDRAILLPIASAVSVDAAARGARPQEISVAFEDAALAANATRSIGRALGRARGGRVDYDLVVPSELLAQATRTQRIFTIVLSAIGAISLLVGGIGIMNIMLVSVAERTREIGLRRAVGASSGDILVQFLTECLALTSLGALAGVGLGALGAAAVSRWAGWATRLTPWSVALALAVALTVGLASGLYPARRASRLDPMRALRAS